MEKKRYRVLSYSILLFLAVYIGFGQYVIGQGFGAGSSWQLFFTGPPRLEIPDNLLRLSLNIEYTLLEIKLLRSTKHCPGMASATKEANEVKLECSQERDWITIRAFDGQSLRGVPLAINLADPQQPEVLLRRYITMIRIDKRPESIPGLYQSFIDRKASNLNIYYPFHVFHVSTYFAELFGNQFMWLISTVLLVILASQGLLFLISIVWQPEVVTEYFNDRNPAVTFVDEVSNRFAIPLRFLGTVCSIWYSLETIETDYSSFLQVLNAMRVAVFTTVMGLATKILCLIRGYHLRIRGIQER
jgi:hypothetical protein